MTEEQNTYFESLGADVKYEMNPNFEHWFKEQTVAGDISDYLYSTLNLNNWNKTTPYKIDDSYLKEGLYGKWD